jgi:hypothetical protein
MVLTNILPARRLNYYDVVNLAGDDLGQIQEFMVDIAQGRIAFVIVAFGGTLGLTDKWFALPWELLKWSGDRKKFVMDMPREILKSAPGLNKDKWPDEINISWLRSCYAHFGCTPHWEIVDEEHAKKLAYSIWESEGRPEGKALDHYYRSEEMLRQHMANELHHD